MVFDFFSQAKRIERDWLISTSEFLGSLPTHLQSVTYRLTHSSDLLVVLATPDIFQDSFLFLNVLSK